MGILAYIKDFFILASIIGLIGVGLIITLKSGMVAMGKERCHLILGNMSRLVLALSACLAFLMMAQQMAGIRFVTPW